MSDKTEAEIRDHLIKNRLNLKETAEWAGKSEETISRIFKKHLEQFESDFNKHYDWSPNKTLRIEDWRHRIDKLDEFFIVREALRKKLDPSKAKIETAKAKESSVDILTNESIKEHIKQLKKTAEVAEELQKELQRAKEFIKENPKVEEIPLKSHPYIQEIIKSSSNFKSYEESKRLVRSMGLRTREEYLNKKEVENFIKIAEKELYESKKLPYTIFGLCLILLIFLVVWTLFFYGRIGILAIGITFLVILSINLFIPNLLNWIASISEFFGRTVFKLLEKISKRKS